MIVWFEKRPGIEICCLVVGGIQHDGGGGDGSDRDHYVGGSDICDGGVDGDGAACVVLIVIVWFRSGS